MSVCLCLSEGEKQEASVLCDSKQLPPGLQLYRAAYKKNLPDMAEALAHGAEVNWVNIAENKSTPLIQAVLGVSDAWRGCFWVSVNSKSLALLACDSV